jgi:hypothetical protein
VLLRGVTCGLGNNFVICTRDSFQASPFLSSSFSSSIW